MLSIQRNFMGLAKERLSLAEFSTTSAEKCVNEAKKDLGDAESTFVKHSGRVTLIRAMVYALMTCNNTNIINELQLQAGIARYGVCNPMPIVRQRLAFFGNTKDVQSLLKDISKVSKLNLQAYSTDSL